MSALGPKQTWAGALHMSAFGGKADMTFAALFGEPGANKFISIGLHVRSGMSTGPHPDDQD
jgi:hypothetical protein